MSVEPAIQPTKPDQFEPRGGEAQGKKLKNNPKKPKKSMIPMVLFSVVALAAAGFGIWAVTHKEEAGKLLDNAKEGVNKLFKKEEEVKPPDNTGGNPSVPPITPDPVDPSNPVPPVIGDNKSKGWKEKFTELWNNLSTKPSKIEINRD